MNPSSRRRLGRRDDLVTVLLGAWVLVGIFADGWAHRTMPELESFFTPWHAIFYSGFLAASLWVVRLVTREQRLGRRGRRAIPLGYGLGVVGLVIFGVGGAADLVWHETVGIEQDLAALFSPPHLLLFLGGVLVLSSPLRAAWTDDPHRFAPRMAVFLPTLLSATLTVALVAFMSMFLSAYLTTAMYPGAEGWAAAQVEAVPGLLRIAGVAAFLATNLLLVVPVLLLARRWQLPFGTVTVLWGSVALLMTGMAEFGPLDRLAATLLAGIVVDTLVRWLRPSPSRPVSFVALGGLAPLVLWTLMFAAFAVDEGIGWPLELWTGTIVWNVLLGSGAALLFLDRTRRTLGDLDLEPESGRDRSLARR